VCEKGTGEGLRREGEEWKEMRERKERGEREERGPRVCL